ncbi:MAG: DUF1343 domain-containing protein [Calditrichaeota bacterium]|nr:DUF1343 domain-containing protein [Calditrichota bacterium]
MQQKFKFIHLFSILFFAFIFSCTSKSVKAGLDRISENPELFRGKNIGIVTNHTAYNSEGKHISDVFTGMNNVTVKALFGPEHGIRGNAPAGDHIKNSKSSDIPVYSLYGPTRKPTPEMLKDIDLLVFDIQGIGARFYTYIYTMALAMEAAAEKGIPYVVLDRPNPINGISVEGTILDTAFATFVGLYPIPVRHGMTIGELATLFNEQHWLKNGIKANLHVIKMQGWQRNMWFDQTGLSFINPSPNIPDIETATLYPGLCLIEGVNVSEGRGTYTPFKLFGAPWIDSDQLVQHLKALQLAGIDFKPAHFTPVSITEMATNPKYKDQACNGAEIAITNRDAFKPVYSGIKIVETLYQLYPDSLRFLERHFDRLIGTADVRNAILNKADDAELKQLSERGVADFMELRGKYLLY